MQVAVYHIAVYLNFRSLIFICTKPMSLTVHAHTALKQTALPEQVDKIVVIPDRRVTVLS